MEFKKLAMILGGAIGAIILVVVGMSVLGKDSSRPRLDQLYGQNQQMVALSDEAQSSLESFELSKQAADIRAVLASDNIQLQSHYEKRYHKRPGRGAPAAPDPLATLKATTPGSAYDAKYRELIISLESQALNTVNALSSSADRALKSWLDSYREHLNQLFSEL